MGRSPDLVKHAVTNFDESNITAADRWRNGSSALLFLFLFLLGIKGLGDGFSLLGGDMIEKRPLHLADQPMERLIGREAVLGLREQAEPRIDAVADVRIPVRPGDVLPLLRQETFRPFADPTGEREEPEDPIKVNDLYATILGAMGVDYEQETVTPIGRPMKFSDGTPIPRLLG